MTRLLRMLTLWSGVLGMTCGWAEDLTSLAELLERRAAEIVPMLKEEPFCVGRPITDRAFWEALAQMPAYKNTVRNAEKGLETSIPHVADELYLEFSQNGNRSRYQDAYARRNRPFETLVVAECLENQGRFIPRIEEFIRVYAADKSWVLPAHDRNLQNFQGKYDVDLFSSAIAWKLATTGAWLGEKLSPEVRELLDEQLRVRCLEPYQNSIGKGSPKMWWIRGKNNWNAVCLAGVTGTALTHLQSVEEKAWFLAAAEHFIRNSEEGYTDDGYCSEGVGYWNYGFGNHIRLAEIVRRITDGKIQLLNSEKMRRVAEYGFRISILPGFAPSFADCSVSARPSGELLMFLNRYYQLGRDDYEGSLQRAFGIVDLGIWQCDLPPLPEKKEITQPFQSEKRTWFPEAQVLILRPQGNVPLSENPATVNGLAVAMKGGHNAELHNHNDVGSYVVVYRGRLPLLDVGSETYTRRTFSAERYESDALNSWGHGVPVVAGRLQKTGRQAEAKILACESTAEKEVLKLDLKAVYDVPEVQRLTRTFIYHSTVETALEITDEVEFSSPQAFETALVTSVSWKQEGNRIVFGEKESQVVAEIEVWIDGKKSDAWKLTESEFQADIRNREKVRRLGIVLEEPVQEGKITVKVRPVK